MIKLLAIMIAAFILGWTLRNRRIKRGVLSKVTNGVIVVLMMCVGIETGSSDSVLKMFGSIILDAVIITVGALGGTILCAYLANKYIIKKSVDKRNGVVVGVKHTFSMLIIGMFMFGVGIGYFVPQSVILADKSMWVLYCMIAMVGFGVGSDKNTINAIRKQPWQVVFAPVATVVGTYLGILVVSPLISLSITDQLAVGSGFGYYSLSSVMLSEFKGAQIGALALFVNILRELVTVGFAPILVKRFSPLALICSGGATTMDVTLPIVLKNCGNSFVGISIFHGFVIDTAVPILVSFFGTF